MTKIENLILLPTIENIAVISQFSGDVSEINTARLLYREQGASFWRAGIPMTTDRRLLVDSYYHGGPGGGTPQPNPYPNSHKAVIFSLRPNTVYEVRVVYSDPNGMDGPDFIEGTVKTKNDNPPSIGQSYYVSPTGSDGNPGTQAEPWQTIQKAADTVIPGDTVHIMAGLYLEPIIECRRGGLEDNYVTFTSFDPANRAIIDGQAINLYNFRVWSPYIRFSKLVIQNVRPADGALINLEGSGGNPYGAIIEDCLLVDPGAEWPGACVFIRATGGALIQRNIFQRNRLLAGDTFGVFFVNNGSTPNSGGFVVKDNQFYGNFKDAVSGAANAYVYGGARSHTFIYGNYAEGYWDDAWELEGADICCAIFNNRSKATLNPGRNAYGLMVQGMAPVIVGPFYFLRNVGHSNIDAAIKMGSTSNGHAYIYHNTLVSSGSGAANFGSDHVVNNVKYRNNIIISDGPVIAHYGSGVIGQPQMDYDYDLVRSAATTRKFVWTFAGASIYYSSLAAFRAATGKEMHGLDVDPLFIDEPNGNLGLQDGSPAIGAGEVLPGFNDQDSPWPYVGAAPDLGAIEFGAVSNPPVADFTANPSQGPVPLTVQFTDQSFGEITSRLWDFGDGATSTEQNPSHVYDVPGTYPVRLTITGTTGSDSLTGYIIAQSLLVVLTLTATPGGTTSPAPGQHNIAQGGSMQVSAIPQAGYQFVEWREGAVGIGTAQQITIIMGTVDRTVQAVFEQIIIPPTEYSVSIAVIGQGGTAPAPGSYTTQADTFPILATPASGWRFKEWQGVINENPVANPIDVDVQTNRSIVAVFEVLPPPPPGGVNVGLIVAGIGVFGVILALLVRRR